MLNKNEKSNEKINEKNEKRTKKSNENIRSEFNIINNDIAYLDNAATTQKPKSVISSYSEYYSNFNGNSHSEMNEYGFKANLIESECKEKLSCFLNAKKEGLVFVKSATEAVNIIAKNLSEEFGSKVFSSDKNTILVSKLEHHANLLPYREFLKKSILGGKIDFKYIDLKSGFLDYNDLENKLKGNVKVLALTMASNVTGENIDILKVKSIIDDNIRKGILFSKPIIILDASQVVSHKKIDIEKLDPDFLVFSAHKMYGPLGVGVLYIKPTHIKDMNPLTYGGGIVDKVTENEALYYNDSRKFEAGTKDIASIYAFSNAIDFVNSIGIDKINEYEKELTKYFFNKLSKIKTAKIYSSENSDSLVTFNLKGIHGHDASSILSYEKIYVRGGSHCAHILHDSINEKSTVRVSFAIYNTFEEIDRLVNVLKQIEERFKSKC